MEVGKRKYGKVFDKESKMQPRQLRRAYIYVINKSFKDFDSITFKTAYQFFVLVCS